MKEARAQQWELARLVGDADLRGHSFMVNEMIFFFFLTMLSWYGNANGALLGTTLAHINITHTPDCYQSFNS